MKKELFAAKLDYYNIKVFNMQGSRVPFRGGIGVAIGTLVANLLGQIITMNIFYWKKIGLDIPRYWKNLLLFCFPVAVLSGLFYLFVHNMTFGWLKLIAFGALFGIAYLAIVFLYMNKEEKLFIKKTITFGKKII